VSIHQSQEGIDLAQGLGPDGHREQGGGSPGLLQEESRLVDFRGRNHAAADDPHAVFLSGQLGCRSDAANHGGLVRIGVTRWDWAEGDRGNQGGCAENHFHPV
jgi:hypothetical protein